MEPLKRLIAQLGATKVILIAGVTALIIAGLVAAALSVSQPHLALLYTDLEPSTAHNIVDKLKAQKIPYEITRDGTTILAPEDKLGELRLSLAGEQLSGQLGYELLDKQDALGTSSFLQSVNHARAIEGELGRTIQALDQVKSARVHIVLPDRQLFDQQARKPSASITLRTRGTLPASKVNAIRYLVSGAVPDLDPARISIVDQTGTLLARSGGADADALNINAERQATMEQRLREEIETLVERVVGPGHVRAEVTVELESQQVKSEADIYDPDKQVVARTTTVQRSDQNNQREAGGDVSVSTGLPPPAAGTANGTSANIPSAQTGNAPGSQSQSSETSEQTEYQNSKTHTTTIHESGGVKRLSVSVLVDGNYTAAPNGQSTYSARSPAEVEQIKKLVESAVGFNADRGDTVEVANLRFAINDDDKSDAKKSLLKLNLTSTDYTHLAQTGIIALFTLLITLFGLRPLLKSLRPQGQAGGNDADGNPLLGSPSERLALAPPTDIEELMARAAAGDEEALVLIQQQRSTDGLRLESEIDIAQIEGKVKTAAIKKVGEVIDRHPTEATAVVRQWMNS